ncbi:MAG TPA: Asp-tRNA(Asn)/Glu-tRNA(Gln) amidotransferase GatCAB subunit A [Dehalococcoidia bacterium]|nr:Asp-tRNA(Asn)/Glu-tRNA(Gln) amidotransferase GatCAB subunit A [SAR202 cluster bacterium]HAA95164.1 Asp-tRNA(Asn)/Glu-tRNA(Gln) amidotransferase GatCAB subunit A [Dehalococcoidia bacterium]HCL25163.1 Asp-tRNA(Asn)/Glu-tRNA(Gln) amidotransferase GatCAB subunit A [Dehalococcoidia bacterium]|tara:strand:- start:11892 stop:13325 length:1434 start_codon:yes stop_codon:yes gene_type:complete
MSNADLLKMTISELAPKIKNKEVSPVELTEAALAEADRLQPELNSFITILHDRAMDQARESEAAISRGDYRGPLHGIPMGLKDNLATAGITTTVGSKVLASHVPEEDAEVVVRCRDAGAIFLGKENLEEFAAGATSNNPHYGAVHNPWGLDHIPGGSSGGGGANVAAGVTFASLGTDLGGSVRLPGTFCGVVGLKQTYGRVSQRGLMVTSFNGDHIGPMTRSVPDSALVLQVLAGNDPLDPSTVPVPVPDYSALLGQGLKGLKMGIPSNHYFDVLDSEVERAVRGSIAALEELGAELQEVSLPAMEYVGALRIAAMADGVVTHEPFLKSNREDYGPDVLYRTIPGQFVLGKDYSKSLKVQRLIQEEYARVMQQVDFLVTPTAPVPAPRIDAEYININGEDHRVRGPGSGIISRNTSPMNSVGLPAITVPCGASEGGLPIGVQFITGPFEEGLLFRVADSYEKASPSQGLRPAVAVGV